ncbi:MAG TPA: hypothetical protein VLZ83_00380 [Edaphocola sp.]|nr:hypothetical protein [Edaphocola sp.]
MKFKWQCPSNIAIVKYWGKKQQQIPCNASLSMTLSSSFTEIELSLREKLNRTDELELEYFFEGERNAKFEERVSKYIQEQALSFPFIKDYALTFESSNSFPHSAGIASSASAFGAIALCMTDALQYATEEKFSDDLFLKMASNWARLGSGSACRSMYPGYALWGKHNEIANSSDEYAIPVIDIHPNFQRMKDAILIVESAPKKVSSSVGHSLMEQHPYAAQRFIQANERTQILTNILKTGDYSKFIEITESEALTLHAMMMTSKDYYLLMKPGTLIAIEKIIEFRTATKIPICFTLDAGPNVHLLYSTEFEAEVEAFLNNNFNDCVQEIKIDKLGYGPIKINI